MKSMLSSILSRSTVVPHHLSYARVGPLISIAIQSTRPLLTSSLTTSGCEPFVSSLTWYPSRLQPLRKGRQAFLQGWLTARDHDPVNPFPELSQVRPDLLLGYVMQASVVEHEIAVVTERAPEVTPTREKHRRQVILPIEKAGLDEALYREVMLLNVMPC